MPVYMVVPTEDSGRLARVVSAAIADTDRYILPGNFACFVRFEGTSAELAERLDLPGNKNKDDRPCPAVITTVTTYGGFAPTALWAWLKVKMGE